jgi:phosphate transport system protein
VTLTERKSFDEQLNEIRAEVVKLAARVSEQIGRATESMLSSDLATVDAVYDEHASLKELNRVIEEHAYAIFALQQPLAGDLRTLLAVLRILHELELTDGLMRNVARATRRLYPRQLTPRVRGIIERMGVQAGMQLKVAVDSFADNDMASAGALPDMDDVMDDLQKDLFRAIFAEGAPDEGSLQQAVQISFVGRDYERAADHAVTIGHWVRFIATGLLPGHEYGDGDDAPAG